MVSVKVKGGRRSEWCLCVKRGEGQSGVKVKEGEKVRVVSVKVKEGEKVGVVSVKVKEGRRSEWCQG